MYGNQGDNVLNAMRNALRQKTGDDGAYELINKEFSFADFLGRLKLSGDKTLRISNEDLEEFLESKKGHETFLLLSTIYPAIKYEQVKLHQDHIHPHSAFNKALFENENLKEQKRKEWLDKRNMLPNLQLLEGGENQSKNASPFKEWLLKEYPKDSTREVFLDRNYIDSAVSLELKDFETFFEERKKLLKTALAQALEIKHSRGSEPSVI